MHTFIRRTLIVASATSALALSAAPSEAQNSAGRRWQAWVGCWTGIPADEFAAVRENVTAPTTVCITPSADADVVDVTTVADGKVVSRTKLDASGREQRVEAAGCTGTQRAQWSGDERRVYLKSTAMCEGIRTSTSGILAISPTGEWLDVRGVSAGGGDNVRVARYRDVGIPAGLPTELASALTGRTMATQSARVAAGAAVGTNAVIDAVKMSDAAVVEAWLLERRQPFAINANDLIALADAGVPARVTDALVAVSNPKVFAIGRADMRSGSVESDLIAGRRVYVTMGPAYDPWGYGYSPYGYGYGAYGYGYNGYGRSSYGYGSYYPPVIIVQDQPAQPHGRVERGGYTRGGSQSTPSTSSSQPSSTSSNNGSSNNGSGSSGTSSSQPSSSSPAPERTAKPKP
jgi:hypothetical protein